MARGYMGKILYVDLAAGTIQEEALDEQLCREYIGGYGIGARLLYDRMPAGADPLGDRLGGSLVSACGADCVGHGSGCTGGAVSRRATGPCVLGPSAGARASSGHGRDSATRPLPPENRAGSRVR